MSQVGSSIFRGRKQEGFTLVELVVAMTLLGLIFVAVTGGLRFGTQVWRSSALRFADNEDLELVYRVLRRQFASVLNARGLFSEAKESAGFEGERNEASFVATAPARSMAPGLYRITLGVKPDGSHQVLSLFWSRIRSKDANGGHANVEPLLRGVRGVRFSYFGRPDGKSDLRWVDEWPNPTALPRLVRIKIEFDHRQRLPWPSIVVPVGAGMR